MRISLPNRLLVGTGFMQVGRDSGSLPQMGLPLTSPARHCSNGFQENEESHIDAPSRDDV